MRQFCFFFLKLMESWVNSYDNWFWIVQNAELFTLTYGAIVRQLLTDLEEVEEVNEQLDQMYNFESLYSFEFDKCC